MSEQQESRIIRETFEELIRRIDTKDIEELSYVVFVLADYVHCYAQELAARRRIELVKKHPEWAESVRTEQIASVLMLPESPEASP